MDHNEPIAVTNFRRYLRCKTVHPEPDYQSAKELLLELGAELGLVPQVIELVAGKPVVILTWPSALAPGEKRKSLVLNSHIDVVPVFREFWTQDPWAADKVDGRIYARGSQDMKCVGIQYLEAIRALKATGYQPARDIHVLFVPDEEIGGHDGMEKLVVTEHWKALNPAFVLDEGLANPDNAYKVYHGVKVTVTGETGHGSQFIANTPGPKLNRVMAKFLAFRDEQEALLNSAKHSDGRPFSLGDVTTVNLTKLDGGVQYNVIPQNLTMGFDIRVSPTMNLEKFRDMVNEWCASEEGVSWEFVQETKVNYVTPLDSNPWWTAMKEAAQAHGIALDPTIFPAATDSRYLRKARVPALGVSPIRNTPVLLHCHDEYLDEYVFLEGIEFYKELLPRLDQVADPAADDGQRWTLKC
ncbi:adenylate cyclase [Blastocladiella emersonii ATCC 22665]|nr:adenylate cyclase [Blastocladiella emersonii ATCC 22665]